MAYIHSQEFVPHRLRLFAATLVSTLALCLLGAAVALEPTFGLRLAPVLAIPVVVALALLCRSDQPVGERFVSIWLIMLCVILACWPTYVIFKFGRLPSLDARKLIAVFSIVTLFYLSLSRKGFLEFSGRGTLNPVPIKVGLAIVSAFAFWRMVSCFVSPFPISSLVFVFWEIVSYYALFFSGALAFRGRRVEDRFFIAILLLALGIALFSAVEWRLGRNILVVLAPQSDEFAEFVAALNLSRVREGFFRAQGTFEHPLVLAEFCAMASSFGLAAFLFGGSTVRRSLGLAVCISAPATAWLSGSRVSLVAIGGAFAVVLLLWLLHAQQRVRFADSTFRKLIFVIALGGAMFAAFPALIAYSKGKSSVEMLSTSARVYMLKLGIPSVLDNPVVGLGPGTAVGVAGIRTDRAVSTLDNHLLVIAIESGIPGLLLFLACLIYPAWCAMSALMRGARDSSALLAASTGALAAFVATRSILAIPYNLSFAFLIGGIVVAICARESTQVARQ